MKKSFKLKCRGQNKTQQKTIEEKKAENRKQTFYYNKYLQRNERRFCIHEMKIKGHVKECSEKQNEVLEVKK